MLKTILFFSVLSITKCVWGIDVNILKYGAVNDTNKLSTKAINKAIEDCYRSGGGRVVIPAGNFRSGTIILKSNVELYLETGATLFASTDHQDFPRLQPTSYVSQKDKGGWFALIYAEAAINIKIKGGGKIDGNGARQNPRPGLFAGDLDGRPRNILLISCKNVQVEGITMLNSGIWNQHYMNCEDVVVNGINVFNHANRNNDGIDIDGCRRFILSNSIIDSDDDGICLKSTGSAPCEDIIITGCIISSHTNAIKCGTESTGGFKNINISNCIVRPSRNKDQPKFNTPHWGYTGVSLEIVDGGIMDGVNVNNIVIEGTECPIYVRLGNRGRKHTDSAPPPPVGKMRNIQISDITGTGVGNYSSSITGIPGAMIDNISLDNIRIVNIGGVKPGEYIPEASGVKEAESSYPEPKIWGNLPSYGLFIRHVKNVTLGNVSFKSIGEEPRIPVIACDVYNLNIRGIESNKISDEKFKGNIKLISVLNVTPDNSVRVITTE